MCCAEERISRVIHKNITGLQDWLALVLYFIFCFLEKSFDAIAPVLL